MDRIKLAGRTDLNEFWRLSDVTNEKARHPHAPFLLFVERDGRIAVEVHQKLNDVLSDPDETPVMKQWPGQWRSDFFRFTVGELRRASGRTP